MQSAKLRDMAAPFLHLRTSRGLILTSSGANRELDQDLPQTGLGHGDWPRHECHRDKDSRSPLGAQSIELQGVAVKNLYHGTSQGFTLTSSGAN